MFDFSKKSSYLLTVKRYFTDFFLYLVFLLLISIVSLVAGDKPSTQNKYVTCTVSLEKQSVRAGATAYLLISFKPQKGIHINSKPPLQVFFDSTSFVAHVDSLILPQSKKPDLLETSTAVKVPVRLSNHIQEGNITLRGTLTYFYCSDAEGWCSKFKQPFEVTLHITK